MEMVCTGCNGVDGAHVCSVRFEDQASKQAQASEALVLPSQVATPGEISLKSLAWKWGLMVRSIVDDGYLPPSLGRP